MPISRKVERDGGVNDFGGAGMEVEFLDSMSSEHVPAEID